jgi:nicotinamidase/pyrazinamidase
MDKKKTAFFDVDTQNDFMDPQGALYVPGAEHIKSKVIALNNFAVQNGIMLISTEDAHAQDDPEFKDYPAHCVVGTKGQQKIAGSILSGAKVLENEGLVRLPEPWNKYPQLIFQKDMVKVGKVPQVVRYLKSIPVEKIVVYGVFLEICVFHAVEGIFSVGKKPILVLDATKAMDEEEGRKVLAEVKKRGGRLMSTAEILRY